LVFSSHKRDSDVDELAELTIAPFEVYVGELASSAGKDLR
jgi:hypothetical protein